MVLSLEPKRIIWGHFLDPDVRGSKVTRLQLQIVGTLYRRYRHIVSQG